MNAYVDQQEVSLADVPGFSYALADLLDPSKTKGNSSTAIRIVADSRARAVMGSENMQEVVGGTHRLRIGGDGEVLWEGDIIVDRWTRDIIECSAVGGNATWMERAKAMRLRDLDIGVSEIITAVYQRSTWTDDSGPLYFPVIDYGFIGDQTEGTNIPAQRLRPAVRAWWFMRQAFSSMGFGLVARGRWEQLSRMAVMPNVSNDIVASQGDIAARTAQASIPAPQTFIRGAGSEDVYVPDLSVEELDPSGSYNNASYFYSPNATMSVRPIVSCIIRVESLPGNFHDFLRLEATSGLGTVLSSTPITPVAVSGNVRQYILTEVPLPDTPTGVVPLRFRIRALNFLCPGNIIEVEQLRVRWEPAVIPYQTGIRLDIASCAPDWTLGKLIQAMQSLLGLKFITNDADGQVEAWLFDDLLQDTTNGIDWRGREDHTQAPAKERPEKPSAYFFRYALDDKDEAMVAIRDTEQSPGYGNADIDIGGDLDPKEVKTDFAATVMGYVLGDLYVPIMRQDGFVGGGDYHRRVPRLLWAKGTVPATWTHAGTAQTAQPKCFFEFPGEALSMDFDYIVAQYMGGFIQRAINSNRLKIRLRLWDDELIGIDLRRPVMVNDGYGDGWYYVEKINQKTFGLPATTEVQLIQV